MIEDIDVRESEVSISLLTIELEKLFHQFPDHTFGALRPAEQSIFEEQLVSLLTSRTTSTVAGRLNSTTLNDHPFERKKFDVRNGEIEMISPAPGTTLSSNNIKARFVLILDQFYFTPYQAEVGGDTYAGHHEGEIENRLRFETKYLIWDNEIGEAVAWGKVDTNNRLSLTNQSTTYRELLMDAFQQIVKVSPFRPVPLV